MVPTTSREGIGVKFGADLNAYTSIDETVYNIDNVPVNVEGAIDSCLWILYDWADGLTLDPEEVDKERGVIHEEWRGRNSAMMRMQERMLADIFPGNKYGTRLPIGIMEVVDFVPYQTLVDYYEKWYRPDLQGIVIVGDIDVKQVEKKLKKIFKSIDMPKNPAERVYYPVEDNKETIFTQQTDKEQQNYVLQLMYKHDAPTREERNTAEYIRENTVVDLAMSMLNTRFSEIISKENPPYLGAGVGFGDYGTSQTKKSFNVSVTCKKEQIMQAIPMVYTEVERARRFGFTESEFNRLKKSMLAGMDTWYAERDKRTNDYHAQNCIRHFLDNESLMDPAYELELSKATVSWTSAWVPSKSLAVSAMQWPIFFISASPRPRVVTAAVPIRTPLVTAGFWGSPGMAFLFRVMWLASQRVCSSLPVTCMGRRSASIRWLSVPPVTRSKPSSSMAPARTLAFFTTLWA